jgi:hypothetical protein
MLRDDRRHQGAVAEDAQPGVTGELSERIVEHQGNEILQRVITLPKGAGADESPPRRRAGRLQFGHDEAGHHRLFGNRDQNQRECRGKTGLAPHIGRERVPPRNQVSTRHGKATESEQ